MGIKGVSANKIKKTIMNIIHTQVSRSCTSPLQPHIFLSKGKSKSTSSSSVGMRGWSLKIVSLFAAWAVAEGAAAESETLSNIPQTLSGIECETKAKDCKRPKIQRPKSRKAESCTIKCVTTCIRGGDGSPGEGPLNIRRPIVVFKQGFRSRQYCLVECSEICNLIPDGDDDGP